MQGKDRRQLYRDVALAPGVLATPVFLILAIFTFSHDSLLASSPQRIEDTIYLSLTSGEVDSAIYRYKKNLDFQIDQLYAESNERDNLFSIKIVARTSILSSMIRLVKSMSEAIIWLRQENMVESANELLVVYVKGVRTIDSYSKNIDEYRLTLIRSELAEPPPPGPSRLEWYRAKKHRESITGLLEACGTTALTAVELIGETAGYGDVANSLLNSARRRLPIQSELGISAIRQLNTTFQEFQSTRQQPLPVTNLTKNPIILTEDIVAFLIEFYHNAKEANMYFLNTHTAPEISSEDLEQISLEFRRLGGWRLEGASECSAHETAVGKVEVHVKDALFVSTVGTKIRTDHIFYLRKFNDTFVLLPWN